MNDEFSQVFIALQGVKQNYGIMEKLAHFAKRFQSFPKIGGVAMNDNIHW